MSKIAEQRKRRDRRYKSVSYECDSCGLLINGHIGDSQEGAWLYCPNCDIEMNYAVEKSHE